MKSLSREQIIESNPIPHYLRARGVELKKSVGGFKCLCPIHSEKTPSCSVKENLFHCFGCGAGGTVIDLVMRLDGLSAGQAMKKLSGESKDIQPIKKPAQVKIEANLPAPDFKEMFFKWKYITAPAKLIELAEILSVDPMSLHLIGCAWNEDQHFWAFPMRDGRGHFIGIRTRFKNGKKLSVTGSKSGLFYNPCMKITGELLIVEGASDCCAAMTLGFPAIGRASCLGQEDLVNDFIKFYRVKRAVIVADNDEPKKLPDGKVWYPGQDGAAKLQEALKIPSVLCVTPGKDLREMVEAGATPDVVKCLWKDKLWSNPR